MLNAREMTVSDARDTSTENIIKVLRDVSRAKANLARQNASDRTNPAFDEKLRADFLEMNKQFYRLWNRAEEVLKAELKKRLH